MPRLIGFVSPPEDEPSEGSNGSSRSLRSGEVAHGAPGDRAPGSGNGAYPGGYPYNSALDMQKLGGLNEPRIGAPDAPNVASPYGDQRPGGRPYADARGPREEFYSGDSSGGGGRPGGNWNGAHASGGGGGSGGEDFYSGDSSGAGGDGGPGKVHEISATSLQDMRRVSISMGRATSWLRVVHSGYGQDAWQAALQDHGLTVLQAQSPAEGAYVRVPEDKSAEDMVIFLTEINRNVRRRTRFRDMNRANKSRLQFKCEPFVVTPDVDQIPELVRTSRFVATSMQWHGSGSGHSSGTSEGIHGLNSGNSGDFLHPKDPDFLRDGAPYGAPADRGLQVPFGGARPGGSPKPRVYHL